MPHYYFDVSDSKGFGRDETGTECVDCEDARRQCRHLLATIVADQMAGAERLVVTCDVRDGMDHVVYRGKLTF